MPISLVYLPALQRKRPAYENNLNPFKAGLKFLLANANLFFFFLSFFHAWAQTGLYFGGPAQ